MTTMPAALPPIGFWSYTRSDDESARGKLSQLRVLVASELQHLAGREPVRLFQDTRAIPPGTEWDQEIRAALGQSSFLVPIITPALLQSEWCCREIAIFREREIELGRSDLIIPVHYIDTGHLDPTADCPDPAVFALLAGRQWIDFREHRLRNADSEDVARKVAEIAAALAAALRRRPKRPARPSPLPEPALRAPPSVTPPSSDAPGPVPPRIRHRLLVALPIAGAAAAAAWLLTGGLPPPVAPARLDATREASVAKGSDIAPMAQSAMATAARSAPVQAPGITPCDELAQSRRSVLGPSALVDGVAQTSMDVPRARAACEAAVGAYPDEPRLRAWLGRSLEAGGFLQEAAATYRIPAERNHPIAQLNLGLMLRDGRGIPRDDAQALQWLRRAAEQDMAPAQSALGGMLRDGRGTERDAAQALRWFRRAADQGSAAAQNQLGNMLRDGTGTERNEADAAQLFRAAAEQGSAAAQNNLGLMLREGRGVEQDDTQAVQWFRRAAEQGNAFAQNNLGWMLRSGRGMARDDQQAAIWFQRAAAQGNPSAQNNLAGMLRDGRGMERDVEAAVVLYQTAARQGHADAQDNLRRMNRSW